MYVAGGHTKTSVNIWSMEGSIESGKLASNLILSKYKKPLAYCHDHDNENVIIKSIRKIDDILYRFNLPSIVDILLILIVIIVLHKILKIIKKLFIFHKIVQFIRYQITKNN